MQRRLLISCRKQYPKYCISFDAWIYLSKFWPRSGGGGGGVNTRVIVEYEQKGDQAKSTALETYFFFNSVEVEHKKL